MRYRVHSIEVEEAGEDGSVETKRRNVYSEQGAIIGFYVWKEDAWVPDEEDMKDLAEMNRTTPASDGIGA